MSKSNWKPPKGIGVVYKGKGYRKKVKTSEESARDEEDLNKKESDDSEE